MSQGVLAFAVRSGRLLDARWFPDDVALEDAHFGAPVAPAGPSEAERAFEAAGIAVKTAGQTARQRRAAGAATPSTNRPRWATRQAIAPA